MRNTSFVEEAIAKLKDFGCIEELSVRPFCCNPLTVAEGEKLRLVLDLRHVNQYVSQNKFKYEDLRTFAQMSDEGDCFCTFDLRNGYHHIDIHPLHRKYLGFEWLFSDGTLRYFCFKVLPFGLNSASYLFTKVLRPFIKKWRGLGIKAILYLDDGIIGKGRPNSGSATASAIKIVVADLIAAGFMINYEKSLLDPTQIGIWLDMSIDTNRMLFTVPDQKLEKLLAAIHSVLSHPGELCNAKQLSSITGQLSAMSIALGPLVRFMTRAIYHAIAQSASWYALFKLPSAARKELNFWASNVKSKNGFAIQPKLTTSRIMFSDASDSRYGGFTFSRLGRHICSGRFDEEESASSSTNRELLAVHYCLQSFGELVKNESLQVNVDNWGAAQILSVGSKKPHLQELAMQIFDVATHNNIQIVPRWVPRDQNQIADEFSKLVDTDDWSIDDYSFAYLSSLYGPFTADRFADNSNAKLPIFNSRYHCPGTSGVNAFCENWSDHNNWLCPPISMIGSVIKYVALCKTKGTLLVPMWPSSYFWPLIYPNGLHMASFVRDFVVINPIYSSSSNSVFSGRASFKALALSIDCTR